jgi:hypothetical protein
VKIKLQILAISFFGVGHLCVYGMELETAKLVPSLVGHIDGEHKTGDQSNGRGRVVDIAQDLELGSLDEQDEQAAQVQAILNSLPADARAATQDRMEILSLFVARDTRSVRSSGKSKRQTALLAHALSEGLKVQTERNRLMAAASQNSSKLTKLAVFVSGCVLITNIVNVWLSHTGKK